MTLGDDAHLSAEVLATGRITHLSVVAAQLWRLLKDNAFPTVDLKAVLLGGSAPSPALIEQARQRRVPLHTTYGLTELASQVTTTSSTDTRLGSAGRVLPGRELTIAADGEILARGATLCLGYDHGGPIISATDEEGWFHTGDLGRLDSEGYLWVTGRRDNMFVCGGENIHPEAIERAITELSGVRQAIVVPREDVEYGARPVAFVDTDTLDPKTWATSLRHKLSGLEIPVRFLPWPSLDDGSTKLSRKMLRELANS